MAYIRLITDSGSFGEFEQTITYCSVDQLQFPDYEEALERGIKMTGLHSGLITGAATIRGLPAVLANPFSLEEVTSRYKGKVVLGSDLDIY